MATLTHPIVPALPSYGSDNGIAAFVEELLDERRTRAVLVRARASGYLSPERYAASASTTAVMCS